MTHPKADGLDALKREAVQWYKERFDRSDIIGMPSDREVLFDFIDHLAQRGMIVRDGWMPIETAPRDGTVILGAFKGGNIGSLSWYKREFNDSEGWCLCGSLQNNMQPTHWMPLPAAPKMEGKE